MQIQQQVRSLTSRWAASTFSAFQLLIMKYLESINNHEPRQGIEKKRRRMNIIRGGLSLKIQNETDRLL